MSNRPTNDRGGQPGGSRPQQSVSLGQVGRDDAPLLIPITPTSTVDEIGRVVASAGAARVELLVPDNTTALQSIAGNEALREAAKAAGVRVTIFTADEKTTHAARFAKLDVVSVGGTVAAPRPATPRRPTGAQRAIIPPTPQPQAQTPPARQPAQTPPAAGAPQGPAAQPPTQGMKLQDTARQVRPAATPSMAPPRTTAPAPTQPRPAPTPPTQPQRAAPTPPPSEDPFLADLNAFDRLDQVEPPRVRQSDQGALLFDTPGDVGVPRPAQNDDEWAAAFGDLDSAAGDQPVQPQPMPRQARPVRRTTPAETPRERLPQPGIFGALFGSFPSRARRAPPKQPPRTRGRA